MMFVQVDGAVAIVRKSKGVFSQSNVYRHKGSLFVKAAGGFVRVSHMFGDAWGTSHPDTKVVEFDGITVNKEGKA